MDNLKLTEQIAREIQAKVKTLDLKTIEKLRKAKEENGTFDVIVSTEVTDRAGEIVRQDGWDLTNYKNNPIVLWSHDYYSLPIGICTDTYNTTYRGVPALGARGVFLSADINPLAQQVRKMYEYGVKSGFNVGCTTSVGFIPKDFDKDDSRIITRAELLEFSFVPIPANQGVGPANGRALTFDEAKELDLDVVGMKQKGLEFAEPEPPEEKAKEKEAQPGDKCSMDDGSPGVLTSDPKDPGGALVCLPQEQDKTIDKAHASQKELLKSLADEHNRHVGEVEDALEDFRQKSAVVEDQPDENDDDKKKAKKADAKTQVMREALKDLKSSLADEHTMHRAKAIACFRAFNPAEDKAFDKKEHLKALRDEHNGYETKCTKAVDDFEEKCLKSVQGAPGEVEEHTDWVSSVLEGGEKAHKKSVTKIAKGMCKAAFGEQDEADEKVLEILKGHLEAYVPEAMQRAVFMKVGAAISNATKNKLGEAHEHLKAAKAVLEALHPGLADGSEEEGRSDGDEKSADDGPRETRSRPRQSSPSDEALKAHIQAREIVGGIEAKAREALGKLNADIRGFGKK